MFHAYMMKTVCFYCQVAECTVFCIADYDRTEEEKDMTQRWVKWGILLLVASFFLPAMAACEKTMAPTYVLSEDETYYILQDIGTGAADIVIPATYGGLPVRAIGEEAFSEALDAARVGLCSVVIPDSVTVIGKGAFRDCTSLTDVSLGQGVTRIEDSTFFYCTSLAGITLPAGVTQIGNFALAGCTGLKSIQIPDRVTDIGYCAFYHCTALQEIQIPAGVTYIGEGAFDGCYALEEIVFAGTQAQWAALIKGTTVPSDCTVTCADGVFSL